MNKYRCKFEPCFGYEYFEAILGLKTLVKIRFCLWSFKVRHDEIEECPLFTRYEGSVERLSSHRYSVLMLLFYRPEVLVNVLLHYRIVQSSLEEALHRWLSFRSCRFKCGIGCCKCFSLQKLVACRCSKWTAVEREMEGYHASGSLLLLHAVFGDKWGCHKSGSSVSRRSHVFFYLNVLAYVGGFLTPQSYDHDSS